MTGATDSLLVHKPIGMGERREGRQAGDVCGREGGENSKFGGCPKKWWFGVRVTFFFFRLKNPQDRNRSSSR